MKEKACIYSTFMYNLDLKGNRIVDKGKFLFIELFQLIKEEVIEFKNHHITTTNN